MVYAKKSIKFQPRENWALTANNRPSVSAPFSRFDQPHRARNTQQSRVRSMNPTYRQMKLRFTVASPASSSTAAALRSPLPTRHAATAPVRGAATYRALGR